MSWEKTESKGTVSREKTEFKGTVTRENTEFKGTVSRENTEFKGTVTREKLANWGLQRIDKTYTAYCFANNWYFIGHTVVIHQKSKCVILNTGTGEQWFCIIMK